jgi:CheY-like chemotaxis protein
VLSKDARILVIDDSNVARQLLIVQLKALGFHNFLEASNGVEAKQLLDRQFTNKEPVGLIFSDLQMPHKAGKDFIANLRLEERYKKLPIIVSSIESNRGAILEAMTSGADNYMLKPVTERSLKEKLDMVFKKATD